MTYFRWLLPACVDIEINSKWLWCLRFNSFYFNTPKTVFTSLQIPFFCENKNVKFTVSLRSQWIESKEIIITKKKSTGRCTFNNTVPSRWCFTMNSTWNKEFSSEIPHEHIESIAITDAVLVPLRLSRVNFSVVYYRIFKTKKKKFFKIILLKKII